MIGSAYPEIAAAIAADGSEKALALVRSAADKDRLLLDAAYALDEQVVSAAITAGANLKARSDSLGAQGSETVLHRAVRGHGSGDFSTVVSLLLDAGADLTATNASGDNPLHAAMYQSEDRAIALLRLGADPRALDDAGQPPIVKATLLGMLDLVDVLLELGTPIDQRDSNGQTALFAATKEGKVVAIKFLLERGADPNAKDSKGHSAKEFAIQSGLATLTDIFDPAGAKAREAELAPKSGCAAAACFVLLLFVAPAVLHLLR